MNHTSYTSKILRSILAVWLVQSAFLTAQTTSRMSSTFLVRGEQTLLEISVLGGHPDSEPIISKLENVLILETGRGPRIQMTSGRIPETIFEYQVSSYVEGNYTLPPVEMTINGMVTLTQPLDFKVINPDELVWDEVESNGMKILYASSFFMMNPSPYHGETTQTEIKLYVPRELFVEDWGIPEFTRNGVAAWRFQPFGLDRNTVNLLGRPFVSVAYPSTMNAIRSGQVSIGPARVRLTTAQVISDPFPERVHQEVFVNVPKLEFEAKTLPEDAPESFENAVGNFRISVSSENTEVTEGDPLSVSIFVTGSGNLDTLNPPRMTNSDGWKIYDISRNQRGDERRELSGTTVFQQFIRPLELKSEIPPFELAFFDPKSETYQIVKSAAIPLRMLPQKAMAGGAQMIVPALGMPIERMTDILSLLPQSTLTANPSAFSYYWLIHLLGGLVTIGLLVKLFYQKITSRLRPDPLKQSIRRALNEIEKHGPTTQSEFLKKVGSFIEKFFPTSKDEEITALIRERDATCFRHDDESQPMDPAKFREIMRILKKSCLGLVILLGIGISSSADGKTLADQARDAYESSSYEQAISIWLSAGHPAELTSGTLFNIGNAAYRAGSPGYAALYYRRALAREPGHAESLQNLRFIERKFGSITIKLSEFHYALTYFSRNTWLNLTAIFAWSTLIAWLAFLVISRNSRWRLLALTTLFIFPWLIACAFLGWWHFPAEPKFAAIDKQAVVIHEDVVIHADASRTSPEVIDAPPGSLCEIIRISGHWAYIGLASDTRGWVPLEAIELIQAPSPWRVPKFSKPESTPKTT
ncbi:MAG: hypothetical protein EAZ42_06365 [Verrucomicrobia bacterium]|nr:MAG: hypothetical protein EAZ42_06365 [Verrucomicrobiota bacterium]